MPRQFIFISHPNVTISEDMPVPQWPLSELGRARMHASLRQPWVSGISSVYCSTEQKAIDGAEIIAEHLSLQHTCVPELGENDRSATGFLPPAEFQGVADAFFANPTKSVRGWESAVNAQERIIKAVYSLAEIDATAGAIALVSHGAVGTLLYCHLAGRPISRRWDQPPNGGGNYYVFGLSPPGVKSWWKAIDEVDFTAPDSPAVS